MKARFEFTVEDLVDVLLRQLARSKVNKDWSRKRAALVSAACAVTVYFVSQGEQVVRVGFAAAVFFIIAYLYFSEREIGRRKRLERYYRELLGADGPFIYEVEIQPDYIISKQLESESKHPWSIVDEIRDADDGIEFLIRGGIFIVVRNRAFAADEERQAFLHEAQEFLHLARNPKG